MSARAMTVALLVFGCLAPASLARPSAPPPPAGTSSGPSNAYTQQYRAALQKSLASKDYRDAAMRGDAAAAKKILVANGAPADIVIAVPSPAFQSSEGGTSQAYIDNPDPCLEWKTVTWWSFLPLPNGTYYNIVICTKRGHNAVNGFVLTYQSL